MIAHHQTPHVFLYTRTHLILFYKVQFHAKNSQYSGRMMGSVLCLESARTERQLNLNFRCRLGFGCMFRIKGAQKISFCHHLERQAWTSITHLISGVSDLLNTSDASLRDWMCRRDTTKQRNAVLSVGDSKALAETDPSLVSLLSALQYHIIPCNTLQCHGIPCNTRQTHHWCQSSQACPSMPKRLPHVHAPAIILNRWPVRAHKRGRQDAAKDPQIVLQYIC